MRFYVHPPPVRSFDPEVSYIEEYAYDEAETVD